jgi:hypothetical protein
MESKKEKTHSGSLGDVLLNRVKVQKDIVLVGRCNWRPVQDRSPTHDGRSQQ